MLALGGDDGCGSWRSDGEFAFLSAVCWLVSGVVGACCVRRRGGGWECGCG